MVDAIGAMRTAFGRDREIPQRQLLAASMFMPGRVGSTSGIKVVSTTPGNPVGIVVIFDADGAPIGLVDGPTLTAIRTGAVAGLATDLLADPSATSMAMLGAGAMAEDQIAAVRAVRDIDRLVIWSRSFERAAALAETAGGIPARDADQAVSESDVVSTATPSTEPLFAASSLTGRTHINAVGAYTPSMVEIPPEIVMAALVVVDDEDAASHEAGDLISAGRTPDLDLTTLIEDGAPDHGPLTFFKSVGIASQDIAAAATALENAARLGLGVDLGS
jgi:ornithine cyclodeaminase